MVKVKRKSKSKAVGRKKKVQKLEEKNYKPTEPIPLGMIWTQDQAARGAREMLAPPYDRYIVTTEGNVGSLIYEHPSDPRNMRWLRTADKVSLELNKQKTLRLYPKKSRRKYKILSITATALVVRYFIYSPYDPGDKKHYIQHLDGNINNNNVLNLRVYNISDRKHFWYKDRFGEGTNPIIPILCITTGVRYPSMNSVLRKYPKIGKHRLQKNLWGDYRRS